VTGKIIRLHREAPRSGLAWTRIHPGAYRAVGAHEYTVDRTERGYWVVIDHGPCPPLVEGGHPRLVSFRWKLAACRSDLDAWDKAVRKGER
jgi:hypothetical protein